MNAIRFLHAHNKTNNLNFLIPYFILFMLHVLLLAINSINAWGASIIIVTIGLITVWFDKKGIYGWILTIAWSVIVSVILI